MTDDKLKEYKDKLTKLQELKRVNKLAFYTPTEKQKEFHNDGLLYRQRLLMAGNQTGKTLSAAMEIAMHMTGDYPDWWQGHRFKRPPIIWAGGVTAVSTRDNPQRLLLGRKKAYGTGAIPKHKIIGTPVGARGEPDSVDSFIVQHASGGESICYFKNYAQGREKWQGETLDFVWMDEEPPYDIYEEALTRLNRRQGLMAITFTPLMGMTKVVDLFLNPAKDDLGAKHRYVINMTLNDATFYTEEEKENILNQYPEHMRRARALGLPVMGEGLVFPIPDGDILCDPIPIPPHYRCIVGMDFGVNHPTAAVWIAYSPDTDTIYVYDAYKKASDDYVLHADAINSRADWIPVAWPHDGLKTEMGSGKSLSDLYRVKRVNMLRLSARYENKVGGRQAVEPVCDEILNRMRTGRFKVFRHLAEWFREKNMYHRKDGKIVDYNDDLMSATRYAVMMKRFARKKSETGYIVQTAQDYDPLENF